MIPSNPVASCKHLGKPNYSHSMSRTPSFYVYFTDDASISIMNKIVIPVYESHGYVRVVVLISLRDATINDK